MTIQKRDTRNEQGAAFETAIAGIYTAMGFSVSRHVPLAGQEIDIIAERPLPGAGVSRIMIECKYKGGRVSAGNDDVQSIAGAYQIARVNHLVSACTLVTTNGFTLNAQEAAKAAGIHLITKGELLRNLLDFSHYHQQLKQEYAEDFGEGRESWYIPARARTGAYIGVLDKYVEDWIGREDKKPLVILGGYGTGKTSFCRHFAVKLLQDNSGIIPVIVSLRDFHKSAKIESLIRDFLDEQCNSDAPRFDTFWKMYEEGLILLIFDGFDEMASRVDASILEMNLSEIEKFARKPGHMILTCRPEFFTNSIEEVHAFEPIRDALSSRKGTYQRVELDLWNANEIRQFVRSRLTALNTTNGPEYYLEQIESIPALKDISTRAVHLEMVVKILPELLLDGRPISRANLYQTYMEREFRRETVHNKRLKLISDPERVRILQEIASRSFSRGQRNINYETAVELVREQLNPSRSEIDSVARDLLNRSFLRRQGDTYWFAHKSLGEYLYATHLCDRLSSGDTNFLQQGWDSNAVAGLVLELFGGPSAFWGFSLAVGLKRDQPIQEGDIAAVKFVSSAVFDYSILIPRFGRDHPQGIGIFQMLSTVDRNVVKAVNAMWKLFAQWIDVLMKLDSDTSDYH